MRRVVESPDGRLVLEDSGWQVPVEAPRRYQDVARRFMVPFAERLVGSSVGPRDAVLDVACGTGFAARAAAAVVGPRGRVVGSDINAPMLALAFAISSETQDGISWDEASALDLPYADGEFDCVISQQGIQFFPDTSAGLAEMARVTRPGGTIAATVWTDLADSPYFEAMFSMLRDFCGVKEEDMTWWSDRGRIAEWFAGAGLDNVSIERVAHAVSLPPIEDFVPAHMAATPWANDFAALRPDQSADATRYMRDYVSDRMEGNGPGTPFVSHLATITT
jgi:SAM-dependent methyltransferase